LSGDALGDFSPGGLALVAHVAEDDGRCPLAVERAFQGDTIGGSEGDGLAGVGGEEGFGRQLEFLDAVVAFVADVNVAIRGNSNTGGHTKLAGVAALFTPGQEEIAVGIEKLNAAVEAVGDVDAAVLVNRQAVRATKLPFGCAFAAQANRKRPSLSKTWMRLFSKSAM
jgi:hypothetical protein